MEDDLDYIPRKLSVTEQIKGIKRCKKEHGYEHRCVAESVFSSLKMIFDESISSVKWNNIVND